MRLIIIALLFLAGCGQPTIRQEYQPRETIAKYRIIPDEVKGYVQSFEFWAKHFGKEHRNDIIIEFVDEIQGNEKWIGYCYMHETTPRIEIEREYWNTTTDWGREDLIYHELGHCWLGYMHTNDTASIMYPSMVLDYTKENDYFFYIYQRYYVLEMFFTDPHPMY